MKMFFEVLWTTIAVSDLLGVVSFVSEDSPKAAVEILAKDKSRTAKLNRSPERERIVPELRRHGLSSYREIVIKPWRVIYRIEGRSVYVLSVIDGCRNVEDVLLSRLLK